MTLDTNHFSQNLKEEEFKLEKELADVAVSINMVAQKQRTLKFDDTRYKNAINSFLKQYSLHSCALYQK